MRNKGIYEGPKSRYYYKKYEAKDIKIIKNVEEDILNEEEKANLKELQELEKLEKMDKKKRQEEELS